MEPVELLAALRRDGTRLTEVAEGRLDRPVPSCPDWTVADLVLHTGFVELFWADVAAQATGQPQTGEIERPPGDELVPWYAAGHQRLVDVLEAADPTAECWTWAPPHNVGFAQRRMAQEVSVHRWDAEWAAGHPTPIDPDLAVDGIDEYLTYFLDRPGDHDPEPVNGTVHLHCTDVDGEWLVAPETGDGGETFRVSLGHAKGDVALRGSASEILLVLWRRLPLDAVGTPGDSAVAERFVAYAKL